MPSIEETILAVRSNLTNLYRSHALVLGDFEYLVQIWKQENRKCPDFQKILAALDFAAINHASQRLPQADWVPYIVHPLRVALLLWEEAGFRKADILAAAFLHDTLEDTRATAEEIEAVFGGEILGLVKQLTGVIAAEKMSREAKAIKLADRTQNLRDLLDHPPKIWECDEVSLFIEKSQKLLRALEGVNLKLERAYLAALENLMRANEI